MNLFFYEPKAQDSRDAVSEDGQIQYIQLQVRRSYTASSYFLSLPQTFRGKPHSAMLRTLADVVETLEKEKGKDGQEASRKSVLCLTRRTATG